MKQQRFDGGALALFLSCAFGCSEIAESSVALSPMPSSLCEDDIAAPAARAGEAGRAHLLYPCSSNGCTGQESFASEVAHAITIETEAEPDSVIEIESSDPTVVDVMDVASTFDPCAIKLKAWATVHAHRPGRALLLVRDASGEIDRIAVEVAVPDLIQLRASRASAFAFERASADLLASEGESWLVLPELYDAQRRLLVGLPQLTWEVDDPHVAEVRTTPQTEDEQLVREHSGAGAAFVDAKHAGETGLRVRSQSGAEARVLLRVVAP